MRIFRSYWPGFLSVVSCMNRNIFPIQYATDKNKEILIFSWMGQPDLAESSDGRENSRTNTAERMKAQEMNSKLWEAESKVEKEAAVDTWDSRTQHSCEEQLLLKRQRRNGRQLRCQWQIHSLRDSNEVHQRRKKNRSVWETQRGHW